MGKGGLLAAVMAKRFLALFVLIFSVVKSNANQKNEETRSSLERAGSNCQDSAPFFIKNRSRKAKKPYLTVDLSTNAVNGGRKTGEANQQWMWRDCGKDGDGNLVNVATGLCLTKKGKGGMVAECEETKFWFWYEVDGTLENERFEWARLVKQKSALQFVTEMKYLKGTDTPWDWFRWDIEYVEAPKTAPYKLQPEDPGCYESDCPPGCQLVLIAKLLTPFGGLYYGIPAKESHIAVSPKTRLYKSTGQTAIGTWGDWALTYYMFSFSEENGFTDVEDFDPSLAVTDRVNDNNRHIQAASISTGIKIPSSSGLPWWSDSGKANSWELQMDITVTHSTNGTYFMTVGWGPGGYSGIQQTPSTRYVPSGKNFLFSMWDTNTDNHGNAEGGTP